MTDEIVHQFLLHERALYSIAMPGDITTASILFTSRDSVCSYYEIIELDDVAQACAEYLIRAGAPVLQEARTKLAYLAALEAQLEQGTPPEEARNKASRAIGRSDDTSDRLPVGVASIDQV